MCHSGGLLRVLHQDMLALVVVCVHSMCLACMTGLRRVEQQSLRALAIFGRVFCACGGVVGARVTLEDMRRESEYGEM